MGNLNAGDFDRRADLYERTMSTDAQGQQVVTYVKYASSVPARKLAVVRRGYESFAQSQVTQDARYRFQLRYRTDVAITDRLIVEGVTYDVDNIAEIGLHEGLDLSCRLIDGR